MTMTNLQRFGPYLILIILLIIVAAMVGQEVGVDAVIAGEDTPVPEKTVLLSSPQSRVVDLATATATPEILIPEAQPLLSNCYPGSVVRWQELIFKWAEFYQLDPDILATAMTAESMGNPDAQSRAGALGLMQVVPRYHALPEGKTSYFDPDTSVQMGARFFNQLLQSPEYSGFDIGLIFAAYNGGASIFNKAWTNWPQETRNYYVATMTLFACAKGANGE